MQTQTLRREPRLVHAPTRTVAIRTAHGRFVTTPPPNYEGGLVTAEAENILGWECINMVMLGNHQVALQTPWGKYVTAMPASDGYVLRGLADEIRDWERFRAIDLGLYNDYYKAIALRTVHGGYVSAGPSEDGWLLRGHADEIMGWEQLLIGRPRDLQPRFF